MHTLSAFVCVHMYSFVYRCVCVSVDQSITLGCHSPLFVKQDLPLVLASLMRLNRLTREAQGFAAVTSRHIMLHPTFWESSSHPRVCVASSLLMKLDPKFSLYVGLKNKITFLCSIMINNLRVGKHGRSQRQGT